MNFLVDSRGHSYFAVKWASGLRKQVYLKGASSEDRWRWLTTSKIAHHGKFTSFELPNHRLWKIQFYRLPPTQRLLNDLYLTRLSEIGLLSQKLVKFRDWIRSAMTSLCPRQLNFTWTDYVQMYLYLSTASFLVKYVHGLEYKNLKSSVSRLYLNTRIWMYFQSVRMRKWCDFRWWPRRQTIQKDSCIESRKNELFVSKPGLCFVFC